MNQKPRFSECIVAPIDCGRAAGAIMVKPVACCDCHTMHYMVVVRGAEVRCVECDGKLSGGKK